MQFSKFPWEELQKVSFSEITAGDIEFRFFFVFFSDQIWVHNFQNAQIPLRWKKAFFNEFWKYLRTDDFWHF